jgi:ABC-2 type transport system permease protein
MFAEWTKLRTVPSTPWLLVAVIGITIAVGGASVSSLDTMACGAGCTIDLPRTALWGAWAGQAVVAVLAALSVTNEYGTRMITVTLAANPHRTRVLLTKAAVVTGVVLGTGAVAVAGSLLAAAALEPGRSLSLGDEPTLRAATGGILYLGLIGLLGLGIGAIVRDTAGTVTTVLGLLYLFPIAIGLVNDPQWDKWLYRISPSNAGLTILNTVGLDGGPIGPWAGLGVLAGWAGAAMLLGTVLFAVRDA